MKTQEELSDITFDILRGKTRATSRYPDVHNLFGVFLTQLKNYHSAKRHFKLASEINPHYFQPKLNINYLEWMVSGGKSKKMTRQVINQMLKFNPPVSTQLQTGKVSGVTAISWPLASIWSRNNSWIFDMRWRYGSREP